MNNIHNMTTNKLLCVFTTRVKQNHGSKYLKKTIHG